jgi:DNA-binding GntR family transcriptional regulator
MAYHREVAGEHTGMRRPGEPQHTHASGTGLRAQQRPPTLREHATEAIRRAILSGGLRPGERLREEALAAQLGISRGPLREAVRALEQEGLVRSEPHRASYVATLAEDEVWEVYRVRAEVEAIAARRVAQVVAEDAAQLRPYTDLLAQLRRAVEMGDLPALAAADLAFHHRLMEDSGYTHLPRVWATMDGIVRARMTAILAEQPQGSIVGYTAESHAPIVEALASGDPARAAEAVRAHILETRDLWQGVKTRGH